MKGGWRCTRYSRGWQPEQRGLPGPEDSMTASISIFSSKVLSLMASMATLWVLRRMVRGTSQKTCWGPRLMLSPVSVISSMLAMAGLSKGKQRGKNEFFFNYNSSFFYFFLRNISKTEDMIQSSLDVIINPLNRTSNPCEICIFFNLCGQVCQNA